MLFHSLEYLLLFLPVTLAGYFILARHGHVTGKAWLVLASFFFYCQLVPAFGWLLLASILANYLFGLQIHRASRHRKTWLWLAIVCNLGLLGYYKYANFLADTFSQLTGVSLQLSRIMLPLGISFFTFTQLAYLIDVYRREAREYNLLNYFLFVTYFPHLVAGPILHHKEMMPQFADYSSARVNWENIFRGLFLFSLGLFKKVIIADSFAPVTRAGFGSEAPLMFWDSWNVCLGYSLQIYFDFSGYTDMALGAALMFNIRLPANFNSPYKAINIQDFWRRWHMTLSRWLRDYVYIPLGGNRNGVKRTYLYLMITFLVGGLWHGANWTFVVWGGLHGAAVCLHRAWQVVGFRLPVFISWVMTFLFVNVAWVFFGADSIDSALRIIQGMAGLNGFEQIAWAGGRGWIFFTACLCVLISVGLPNSLELIERFSRRPVLPVVWTSASLIVTLMILMFVSTRITEFIYFNF